MVMVKFIRYLDISSEQVYYYIVNKMKGVSL